MSNLSNYYGGSTLLEVGGLPAHLSGASPTSYFCGNMLWRQMMEQQGKNKLAIGSTSASVPIAQPPVGVQKVSSVGTNFGRPQVSQYSQLHVFACQGNVATATTYLEQCSTEEINNRDHKGNTPLIWAATEGQEELAQLLIDNDANVNAQNFAGETALFLCSSFGYDNVVALLLENGANPNIANIDGATPLHMAAANGRLSTIALLASFGAFANCQDNEGDTPLHYAVREGHVQVVEQLVTRCNACVDIPNEDQDTALELASCLGMNDYVQFLSRFSKGSAMAEISGNSW